MKQILSVICLIIVYSSEVFGQGFAWAQGYTSTASGSNNVGISAIASDTSGNIYTTGYFTGTVDFDQGAGVYNLTSVGNGNMFLLKEDAAGNFIWVKHIQGMSSSVYGIYGWPFLDKNGNIYIVGSFRDSFDFDPGQATYPLTTNGSHDVFVLKLDNLGNFIWAKHFGGSDANTMLTVESVSLNKATNNIYMSCFLSGTTIDADPGSGIYYVTDSNATGPNVLLEKLDSAGNFVWAKQLTGNNGMRVMGTAIDSFHNVYITGAFNGTIDFDPSPGVYNLTTGGTTGLAPYDAFIAKYDSAGNYIWAKQIGGGNSDWGQDIVMDSWGNIAITGYFGGTVDFDPGAGTYNLTSNSTRSAFTLKLNNNGDFKWANKTGANVGLFVGRSITTDSAGNVYTALELPNSCDINPGTGVFTVPAGVAVQKLDSSGNFVWGAGWQGGIPGWVGLDHNNSVYTTGTFSGSNKDFDPGPGTYFLSGSSQGSGFIHKMCQGTPPVVPITASDSVGCNGDTIILTAAALPGIYHWSRNNITLPDTTASIKITSTGTYSVRVSGSCPSIGTHHIFFLSKGNPVISLPLGIMSVNIGQQVSVMASVINPGAGSTINWYKNGILFSTTTATTVSYTKAAGTDTIVAVIFGPGNPCYTPDTSNALIIDAVNSVEDIIASNGIAIYPNPSSGIVKVTSKAIIQHIEITDLTGKSVLTSAPNANSFTIDLKGKAAGVYFYSITGGERKMRGKIVVE